jgi:peroxiredoxin
MSSHVVPLQPGDRAPDFELPAVNQDGVVSLAEYRSKGPVLVALFRGLHCPFCRRQIASLATTRNKLAQEGIETLAVVNTAAPRARQYFQYRPTPVVLAADPDVQTHRAFGLPEVTLQPDDADPGHVHWPESVTMAQIMSSKLALPDLPQPMGPMAAAELLNSRDNFEMTESDVHSATHHPMQTVGQFLIDVDGTVRWTFVEAPEGVHQLGRLPRDEDILAAARAARQDG